MIHGPCGTFNPNSPCMADGKGSKQYPWGLVAETITEKCGYPCIVVDRLQITEDQLRLSMLTSVMNLAIPPNL